MKLIAMFTCICVGWASNPRSSGMPWPSNTATKIKWDSNHDFSEGRGLKPSPTVPWVSNHDFSEGRGLNLDPRDNTSVQEHLSELIGLSELPLDSLLRVKYAFIEGSPNGARNIASGVDGGFYSDPPTALPLMGSNQRTPLRRGEHEEWETWDSHKKSSITGSIFSTTITALSFIAFAAYLICMIILAIQQNNNNTVINGVNTMPFTVQTPPVQGRRRREVDDSGGWVGVAESDMYRALIMLSEGYAMYHAAGVRRV